MMIPLCVKSLSGSQTDHQLPVPGGVLISASCGDVLQTHTCTARQVEPLQGAADIMLMFHIGELPSPETWRSVGAGSPSPVSVPAPPA